jgi:hypothetical protein
VKIQAQSKIPLNEKLALTVADAALLASVGRSQIYAAVSSGELAARKRGCSTLILPADLTAWIASLPSFKAAHAKPRGGNAPHEIHKRRAEAHQAVAVIPRREAAAARAQAVAHRAKAETISAGE